MSRLIAFALFVAGSCKAIVPPMEPDALRLDLVSCCMSKYVRARVGANESPVLNINTHSLHGFSSFQQQGRVFDVFFSEDVCENEPGVYGPCDMSRLPLCKEGSELICYNRRPMRNKFYKDNRQPYFYIDYNAVFCYPADWDGCSSCSPGRYCISESRCIMDDANYPCVEWI